MKKLIAAALLSFGFVSMAQAETKLPQWINDVKLSGYVMTQYQYSDQENAKSNSFNLRLGRIALEGRIQHDWYWKVQLQFNGNTSTLGNSPRVVDAFTEWQKYGFFKVKVGQFKRAFTFENPMHPIEQGFFSYSQAINKLSYFSDRSGVRASNGRDIGVQVQGDFLPNAHKRNLLHYQVGVYNGQGINTKDVDQQKDVIGGIWVMPVAGMRLGVFGSEGSYARKGNWTDESGEHKSQVRKLPQHRYAISAEYKVSDWTFRSEYVHSTGKAFKVSESNGNSTTDCTVNEALGNKADAYYALVIAPVAGKKLYAKARYDLYRQSAEWGSSRTQYEAGFNYLFNKNVQLNAEYMRVNDRNLAKPNYNMIDVQLDFRF
jgi:hypothetical protein